ncbi:Rv3235 family protein [Pseudonocardia sp. DR1-2]|uniref:Rv3235 family protein n=1 Tax=Pseudonocardia sp. DR1-2 TaxID=2951168 RepID=UPI002042FBCA|nr:Rv3235 family protein [Pseudonocardia sp. DR1-2]MCM3846719.1 Rv3235 family protein [Pseudonocardia sp. DR1-2]
MTTTTTGTAPAGGASGPRTDTTPGTPAAPAPPPPGNRARPAGHARHASLRVGTAAPAVAPAPGADTGAVDASGFPVTSAQAGAVDGQAPPPGPGALLVRTPADVPEPLAPGVVVVLPGGFRMSSGPAPAPRGAVRPVPAPTVPEDTSPADAERVRAPAHEIVRLLTEVLAGRRPPDGVTAVTTPAVRRYLTAARIVHPARPSRGRPGPGGRVGAPGCGSPGGSTARRAPRVHLGLPRPDVAEVCATVSVAGRVRALALRLDRAPDGRWLATAVRLV